MARIEAHAVQAAMEWATAAAIVEAAAAHAGAALSSHRLAVEADDEYEVQVDPRLTSSALAHVLENAAKYSPAGSTIAVSAATSAEGLRVTVTDEGPGLRDADLDRLFEPFVRGALARVAAGRDGPRPGDHPRPVGGRRRPHLGRRPGRRRRALHDPRAW